MANRTLTFKHPVSGKIRKAPIGFSWTTLFFGAFPLLFRSNWKWFVITFLIQLLTYGLSSLVFMFMINKLHAKHLIEEGYKPVSVDRGTIEEAGLMIGEKLDNPAARNEPPLV